jgi:hypothetical protein
MVGLSEITPTLAACAVALAAWLPLSYAVL